MTALSEYGDSLDDARLRSRPDHARGRMRALALRGLARIGAADSGPLLEAALRDPSTRVVGAAIAGYARGTESLTLAILNEALESRGAPRMRMRLRLIGAARLLSKWDRLQFLLALCANCGDAERDALHVELRRWIASANQSFIAPKPQQQLVLRHAVETARDSQPARIWNDLQFLI